MSLGPVGGSNVGDIFKVPTKAEPAKPVEVKSQQATPAFKARVEASVRLAKANKEFTQLSSETLAAMREGLNSGKIIAVILDKNEGFHQSPSIAYIQATETQDTATSFMLRTESYGGKEYHGPIALQG